MTERVCLVIDGAPDQKTGGYIYDAEVARGMRDRGVAVDVLSLRGGLGENLRLAAEASRRLAQGQTVLIDELCHPRAWLCASLRRLGARRGRLLTLVHHLVASERSGIDARARLAVERQLLLASDGVIATSETTRAVLLQAGVRGDRCRVVLPGKDRLGSASTPPPRASDGRLRVLFIGSLTPRKDPLTLLEATRRLPPGVTVTMVGPTQRDADYARRVLAEGERLGGRARALGELDDSALAAELREHDVLALTSRYEGFGMVLGEAMAHGLAVIATRAGAIAEATGGAAALVRPGDSSELSRALLTLYQEPAELEAAQGRSLARAAALPSWEQTRARFAEAVADLTSC